jgi:SprT-like family
MRARSRAKIERRAFALASLLSPAIACRLRVIWARSLPDAYGYAWRFTIVLDEQRYTPEDGEDTLRHEIAHVLTFEAHPDATGHGPEFRAMRKRLDAAIEAWEEEA